MSETEEKPIQTKDPYWTLPRIVMLVGASALVVVVAWKAITGTVSIDLTTIGFSDFLSLALALFAIWLSMIFYLKATETSNTFYDNTYKFTNNVSTILGRIEAGFSEKLKHIDEGYSRLGDKFDKIPFNFAKAEQEIAKEEETIDEKQKARDDLINELLEKARLHGHEREAYAARLKDQETELQKAREETLLLKRRLAEAEVESRPGGFSMRGLARTTLDRFRQAYPREVARGDIGPLQELFSQYHHSLNDQRKAALKVARFVNKEGQLTPEGYHLLRIPDLSTPD